MFYNIKLEDVFEGPFDLLLFLIHKHEVDIYDIPIIKITQQFIEYVEKGDQINLEHAGEFIEMIAILMRIKTRMLLPKPELENDEEFEDPRTELVQRLIEYKQYKEASLELEELATDAAKFFPRSDFTYLQDIAKNSVVEEGNSINNISLYDLMLAYKNALNAMPKVVEHHVQMVEVSLEDQSKYILNQVKSGKKYSFSKLFKTAKHKIIIVVSFIALLDLIRLEKVKIIQDQLFNDILIESA